MARCGCVCSARQMAGTYNAHWQNVFEWNHWKSLHCVGRSDDFQFYAHKTIFRSQHVPQQQRVRVCLWMTQQVAFILQEQDFLLHICDDRNESAYTETGNLVLPTFIMRLLHLASFREFDRLYRIVFTRHTSKFDCWSSILTITWFKFSEQFLENSWINQYNSCPDKKMNQLLKYNSIQWQAFIWS